MYHYGITPPVKPAVAYYYCYVLLLLKIEFDWIEIFYLTF